MTQAVTESKFEKKVTYDLIPHQGDLPKSATTASRSSQLQENLQVVRDEHPGEWWIIAVYEKPNGAASAKNTLRVRHGKPEVEGYTFATRRIDYQGLPCTGLYARWDADAVQPGEKEAYQKQLAESAVRAKKRRDEKVAKAAREAEALAKAAKAG